MTGAPGALGALAALVGRGGHAVLALRIPLDPAHLPQLPDHFPPGVREALLALALALPATVAVAADAWLRRCGPARTPATRRDER
ncbi:MAG TPA: hypothetical protein VEZ47_05400 [Gemmatirosa sp.]|nr:hypothetical protein [Gemmatirosa sp.]